MSILFDELAHAGPEHLDRGYAAAYRWLLAPLLEHAGFEIRDVDYRRRVYASYTCVRRP